MVADQLVALSRAQLIHDQAGGRRSVQTSYIHIRGERLGLGLVRQAARVQEMDYTAAVLR